MRAQESALQLTTAIEFTCPSPTTYGRRSDMRPQDILFLEDDLDSQLRARQQRVSSVVDDISKEQFLVSTDQELVDYIVAHLTVEPLALQEGAASMSQDETEVDVSGDPMRFFLPGDSGPCYIPGTRVDIDIPFTGEEWIFRYRTNPYSFSLPHAEVSRGKLRVSISLPHDTDSKVFEERYQRELSRLRECVERSHDQVVSFNEGLPRLAGQAIASRRERLSRHADIAALLDIPLAAKTGAPSIAPVRVEIRRPPPLPVPPKTGLRTESQDIS